MAIVEERVDRLEEALMKLAYAQFNTEMELRQLSREMKSFKDEMRAFKDEMQVFRDESLREQKAMNKQWGELANKMGTVVEDIVAPNLRRIAHEYFGAERLDYFGTRITRRHATDPSKLREFDGIVVWDDKVLLNETKETLRDSYIRVFLSFLRRGEFFEYFPEFAGKRLIPVFASLAIGEDKVRHLSRQGVYAMAMTDTTMDLLNFEDCRPVE